MDRLEVASARISEGEFQGLQKITAWAKENSFLEKIEVLAFVDNGKSITWIEKAGAKTMNLLCKGSLKHLVGQLKKSLEQHVADISEAVTKAAKRGISSNVYLEDWSNGMRNSPDYVIQLIEALRPLPIKRFMLADTLGVLNPRIIGSFFNKITDKFPDLHFDCHTHNDYDLAVANVLEAVQNGASGVHTTVNGLGERAGNAPLASVVAVLTDHLHCEIGVKEKQLSKISKMVEIFSGTRIPTNKPIVGENVFTALIGGADVLIEVDGDEIVWRGERYTRQ